jgi:hypothetical protein
LTARNEHQPGSSNPKLRQRIAQEQTKLSKPRQQASAPPSTPDPNFFRNLVVSRERALAELERELADFPHDHPTREATLNGELTAAVASHRAHLDKTFSRCLAAELRSANLLEGASAVRAQSMSFFSRIFKPETLLKIWSLVQPS